jgi:aryl-alcohol dehydrogenase-like predicted oxidoreductase
MSGTVDAIQTVFNIFDPLPLDCLIPICLPEYADSLADLAIKFVLKHPGVTTALVSMHVPEYANQNIAALDKEPLPDDVFQEIFRYHRWVRNFYDTKFW